MSSFFKLAYDIGAKIIYNLVTWVVSFFKGAATLFVTGWSDYIAIYKQYFPYFSFPVKVLAILLAIILVAIPIFIIVLIVRRLILRSELRKQGADSVELYKEIGHLNKQVMDLMDEKAKILELKSTNYTGNYASSAEAQAVRSSHQPVALTGDNVAGSITGKVVGVPSGGSVNGILDPLADPVTVSADLGLTTVGADGTPQFVDPALNAVTAAAASIGAAASHPNKDSEPEDTGTPTESRFLKLSYVDAKYLDYERPNYDDVVTLEQFVERFRRFAASQLHLYYTPEIIRRFVAGFSASRILILEGISGTGKTSLPYAFSRFVNNPATMVSVQPNFRDRTELIGYFNEFTKHFNETEFLRALYEANYREDPNLIVLDEMNLARIEYYFAEMLSVLELPNRDEWMLDLVPTAWPNDPAKLINGKISIQPNLWFIGTANNDDSTFTITDKVYDRAIPIELNERAAAFECELEPSCYVTSRHLEQMFEEAKNKYPISEELMDKMNKLDAYLQTRFKLAFGNRITKQMYDFIPSYVACGGTEVDGMDYIISRKVLKKFESLNISFVRDEIKNLISYLDNTFGETNMRDSRNYLLRIQNLY